MSKFVRLFTCASVLSFTVAVAMASIVACSSSTAAAPAGDDDDDEDDAGPAMTKDAGGNTTEDATIPCNPEGTYSFSKPFYKVTTPGAVCDNYAKAGNEQGGPRGDVTLTKVDALNYKMTIASQPDYALVLVLDLANGCQLAGADMAYQQKTVDADKKEIMVALAQSHFIDIDPSKATDNTTVMIQSDPAGAPGTPCVMIVTAGGTKK